MTKDSTIILPTMRQNWCTASAVGLVFIDLYLAISLLSTGALDGVAYACLVLKLRRAISMLNLGVWLAWVHGSFKAMSRYRVRGMPSGADAIWGYVIPLVSFVVPVAHMRRLYRATIGDWQLPIVGIWWGAFICARILDIVLRPASSESVFLSIREEQIWCLALLFLGVLEHALQVTIIRRIGPAIAEFDTCEEYEADETR